MSTNDVAANSLKKAIVEWQTKLLQLDRKNRLLYFRTETEGGKPVSSIVHLQSEDLDGLFSKLTDSTDGLAFPYAERRRTRPKDERESSETSSQSSLVGENLDTDEEPDVDIYVKAGELEVLDCSLLELQKRLRALRKKDKEFEQEQGINILFLAFGFISWIDEQDKEALAPLLLVPCDLEANSLKENIRLVPESDDLLTNITLKQKLKTLNIELPEFDHENDTITSYLAKCETKLCDESDWKIRKDVYLSTFAFSKIAMWEDLERMLVTGFDTPALKALSGAELVLQKDTERSAITDAVRDEEFAGAKLDDELESSKQFLVLPADYSQLIAVEAARSGNHLVIHGPPGTGKSQTIANLIGSFMADGKTVLFVSEKSAALDVVKKRLEKCGLGNFCIDLHGKRAKKDAFYEQLRTSTDDDRANIENKFPHAQFEGYRKDLNKLARDLHAVRTPLQTSVYRMHGAYAKVKDALSVDFEIANSKYLPAQLDETSYRKVLDYGEKLSKRQKQFSEHLESKWMPLKDDLSVVKLADDIQKTLSALKGSSATLSDHLNLCADETGLPLSNSAEQGQKTLNLLSILRLCPGVPRHWLNAKTINRLRNVAKEKREEFAQIAELEASLKTVFPRDIPNSNFQEQSGNLQEIAAMGERMAQVFGPQWQQRIVTENVALLGLLKQASEQLDLLRQNLDSVTSLLRIVQPVTKAEINKVIQVGIIISDLIGVPARWFEPPSHREIERAIAAGRNALETLSTEENSFLELYDEGLIDKLDRDTRLRFIADYESFFGRLMKRKQHQADINVLRLEHKKSVKPTRDEAIWAIDKALAIQKLRRDWNELKETLELNLGALFEGRDTDWTIISERFGRTRELFAAELLDASKAMEIASNSSHVKSVKQLTDDLKSNMAKAEETLQRLIGSTEIKTFSSDLTEVVTAVASAQEPLAVIGQIFDSWKISSKTVTNVQQLAEIASTAIRCLDLKERTLSQNSVLFEDFSSRYAGQETDWQSIENAFDWVDKFLLLDISLKPETLMKEIEAPKAADVYEKMIDKIHSSLKSFQQTAARADSFFDVGLSPCKSWDTVQFTQLLDWIDCLLPDSADAPDWVSYREVSRELNRELGSDVMDKIRVETDDASQIPRILTRRFVSDWLEHVYHQEKSFASFSAHDQNDLIGKFRQLDEDAWPIAAREEIRRRVFGRYPSKQSLGEVDSDMPRLRAELSKKKRRMPIRRLLEKMPKLVKVLKPCFFMSPLSVSQHLPAISKDDSEAFFDVLIFDEASQIFPEDAVPAIARSSQIIVVGDEKQLPPTNFFRNTEEQTWETYEEEDEQVNTLSDSESILTALKQFIGRGVFERYLKVHYRSRHESLIQFSNHYFYDKKLLVFPSPSLSTEKIGLCDIYVPDGRFDSGGRRTNRIEAERVVELVFDHMRRTSGKESLGVVAFSVAQAQLIEELINQRKLNEPDVAHLFNEDIQDEFFVKNLETVQGDERDHIILGIGYGPTTATGQLMNRFGPINNAMGSRRLNVAITRARQKLSLVRSFDAAGVTSQSAGVINLKRFIEFAQDPMRYFEKQVVISDTAEADSPFEVSVRNALEERGHKIQIQVGVAGYRIDMAVVAPDGLHYDLGIECDGAQYHSSPAARDRDWLREKVLVELGWTIHRIWSTAWIRSQSQEIDRLEAALEKARKDRSRLSVPVA